MTIVDFLGIQFKGGDTKRINLRIYVVYGRGFVLSLIYLSEVVYETM